jgi:glycosyltransferase involved in cell wall biosynthesis
MCRALQSQGCETLVATTDADGESRLPVRLGEVQNHEGVPTIFFSRQMSEAFKYSRPLSKWLGENVTQFDVVHIHAVFSHACLAAARACRAGNVPYVVRPLGTLDPWSMRQKPFRKQLMWSAAAARMMRGAAAVHYTTAEEQSLAESSLGLARGVVIPLGVECEARPEGDQHTQARGWPAEARPYVLSLSRIHPKKNLEMLIEVFSELTAEKTFADWRLVIAGDGDAQYVSTLKSLASRLGGEQKVTFPGWLDGSEKKSALKNAEVLALTSQQENFGVCVVEALASGVPVVVSEQVNLAATIREHSAGWVTSLQPASMRVSMREILSDAGERKRRGMAGHQLVLGQFSWSALAGKLVNLYRSVAVGS